MRPWLAALAIAPTMAMASDGLVAELDQRLQKDGVEILNTHLNARPSLMAELNQSAADCHPQAVDLTVKLGRGKNAKATNRHREALRAAAGGCAEFVLARLAPHEVPRVCASVSSWTVGQMARELRRRIKEIDADERLRQSAHGKACKAAYLYELQNTRVGLRVDPPAPR